MARIPHQWKDVRAEGGTILLTANELAFLNGIEGQLGAAAALSDVKRAIENLPEDQPIVGFVFAIALGEKADAGNTTAYLWGPSRVVRTLIDHIQATPL